MKKIIPITLLLIILFSSLIHAVSIGVSPSKIQYEKVLKGGFAQKSILVSTDTPNDLIINIEKSGAVSEWISFNPKEIETQNITVNSQNPYLLNVVIQPPKDTQNGNYTGYIRLVTDSLEDVETGKGSSVKAAFMIFINVEVVGHEIVGCKAGGISISSMEIGDDISLYYTIENIGNVKISPEIFLDISGTDSERLQSSNIDSDEILPTLNQNFEKTFANNLRIGQYFAKIQIPLCQVQQEVTFNVVEPGGISDTGELVKIENPAWAETGKIVPITAVFKNMGERTVRAKFVGTIKDAAGEVVKIIDTDYYNVKPGETYRLQSFYKPSESGQYFIAGKINFNGKVTFEKASIINVNQGAETSFPWIYIIIFIIIVMLLLIIIRKKKMLLKKKKLHHQINKY